MPEAVPGGETRLDAGFVNGPEGSSYVLPEPLRSALVACGLVETGQAVAGHPLTGGVSSDIWVADLETGPVCVKRALPRLRVAVVWEAPVERSASEAAWLHRAAKVIPDGVPPLLGYDPATRALVLGWLNPVDHPNWKTMLMAGTVQPGTAAALGDLLGRFHSAMARDSTAQRDFANIALFEALRLEPYFGTTARRHPALAERLGQLRRVFVASAATVVHGDVSPKNVLVGPRGPVLLDAECATWGDAAFDPAFAISHLILKARHLPALRDAFERSASQLFAGYRAHVNWEDPAALEARTAAWVPALLLARVDGSSPAEYLHDHVRDALRCELPAHLHSLPADLTRIADLWRTS